MPKNIDTPFSLALVTGASSGIGEALCRLLATKGIALLITGRDPVRLRNIAEELKAYVQVTHFVADLSKAADRKTMIERIHTYSPDLVVNNAGFGLYGEALSYDTQVQVDLLNVNATAILEFTLEAARAMLENKKTGVILNVSSAAGELTFPSFAAYAASKAFVTHLSQSLDYEFQPHGIRVLVTCPGVVDTSFRERASNHHTSTSDRVAMDSNFAAKEIWRQIEKRIKKVIFDWKTRWGIAFSKLLPQKMVVSVLKKSIKSYHPPRPLILRTRPKKDAE